MKTLGIIPARGGSKGVPRKNLALLLGRPLLAWTAQAALAARRLDAVMLSTDDAEIASVGAGLGIEVPFLRPAELARDDTPTLPVLQHAVRELEKQGRRFDAICLLQPTSPLRAAATIDGCIERLERSDADAVVTILAVPPEHHPHWSYFQGDDGALRLACGGSTPTPRRQDLPPAFHREGSVYVVRRGVLMDNGSLYGDKTLGFLVDAETSANIDSPADLARAEMLLTQQMEGALTTAAGAR